MVSTKKLNFFPPKGGVSKYFSPRTILHQENINYEKHCKIPFGSYVQVYNENKQQNTQHPRTINCLYMRYTTNQQPGHQLLDICTGALITRDGKITVLPITQNIIDIVEKMAKR